MQEMIFIHMRPIILLLVTVFFIGCDYSPNKIVFQSENRNKIVSEDENQNKVLFKGEAIDVIESIQSNFEQLPFDNKENEFCFQEINEKVVKKLPSVGFKGDTKYFKLEVQKRVDFGTNKFTLRLTKEQFAKINLDSIKKLDAEASETKSNELYFIKNGQYEYLATIGQLWSATGIGVYYWSYLIVPLDSNKQMLSLSSVSNDPRTIKIDDAGLVFYTQINQNYYPRPAADPESTLDYFPVIVSLLTFDGESNKKFEFNYNCRNWKRY